MNEIEKRRREKNLKVITRKINERAPNQPERVKTFCHTMNNEDEKKKVDFIEIEEGMRCLVGRLTLKGSFYDKNYYLNCLSNNFSKCYVGRLLDSNFGSLIVSLSIF